MDNSPIAVRITKDGQIPLPDQVREELGLMPLQEVRLFRRGRELVVQPVTDERSLQERVEMILRRAKVRAAVLAREITTDEAWAVYDQAAAALSQALQESSPETDAK